MNSITVAGRIGQAPEQRSLPDGTAVLSFSVADDQGRDKKPIWWECALFGRRAEALAPYLTKGSHVTVTGKVTQREYTDKQGQQRRPLNVRVNDIALQGGKPQATHQRQQQQPQHPGGDWPTNGSGATADFDDDIPFADPYADRAMCLAC